MRSRAELDVIERRLRELVDHLRIAPFADRRIDELHARALEIERDLAAWQREPSAAASGEEIVLRVRDLLVRAKELASM